MISDRITAEACGKFILAGEHSIVRGGIALAFPLPKLRLQIELMPKGADTPQFPNTFVNGVRQDASVEAAIGELYGVYQIDSARALRVTSQIPIGSGLGSSAALCTALARGLFNETGEALALRALGGEKIFHQQASGVDPFTVAFAKPLVFYGQNQPVGDLNLAAFRHANLAFVLADSQVSHQTRRVQAQVVARGDRNPQKLERSITALQKLAELTLVALEINPLKDLGPLMNRIHQELVDLGVSIAALETTRTNMLALPGCLGAKLTGAGSGGYVLGLFDLQQIQQDPRFPIWESAGLVFR